MSIFAAMPAFAASGSQNGTWTINYYSNASCTTAWAFSQKDGGGFASSGNLGAPTDSPVLAVGDTIYFTISVTGGDHNVPFYYEVDGGNAPWPAGPTTADILLTTDNTGAGTSACRSFGPVTQDQANAVSCTVPQKIAEDGVGSNDFDGNIIDHFLITGNANGQCGSGHIFPPPPVGIPQFPLGLALLLAAAIPALLLVKRKQLVA